jgi:HrpA-like RNA helicase
MGHGVMEGRNTDIMYMTTGVLITYFTHKRYKIAEMTHIIIDEVHERSIENDLACMFSRRCLDIFPNLKVILMSATVQSSLYQQYFGECGAYGDLKCLSVGVKRYPIEMNFIDDIKAFSSKSPRLVRLHRAADQILKGMEKFDGNDKDNISQKLVDAQYAVVDEIISNLVPRGSGVLIFLSGMVDITVIYENLEKLTIENSLIKLFVIHSDIPLEEQEEAFLPVGQNEIKVVLATNAAESSITIPDVDFVICLGTCKSVKYDQEKHKKFLKQSWISQASAIQRAGRTGRVSPGVVFRLYPRSLFDKWQEHNPSAVQETPMQDVILKLKSLCENSDDSHDVLTILSELIEPPGDVISVKKIYYTINKYDTPL